MKTHECHTHAKCDNTVGLYRCECNNGYHGDGFSCEGTLDNNFYNSWTNKNILDHIDKCATGAHECGTDQICTDTSTNYYCTCPDGFFQEGAGVDITCRPGAYHTKSFTLL